jgi:hypothetical protein
MLSGASGARAQDSGAWRLRKTIASSVEVWTHPSAPGRHGVIIAGLSATRPGSPLRLDLQLNTDTLRAAIDGVRVTDWLSFGARGAAEFGFASIMPDYYADGQLVSDAGFAASYVSFETWFRASVAPAHSIDLQLGGRAWRFDELGSTADDVLLPGVRRVFEPRLRYTYWNIQQDVSWYEENRLFRRTTGVGIGTELGADLRDDDSPWAGGSERLQQPEQLILRASAWLAAGWAPSSRVRLQTLLQARVAEGEDALTAARVGGIGPYFIPVSGLPWAAVVDDTFAAAQGSIHVRVVGEHEVGASGEAVISEESLRDVASTGNLYGASVFADLRWTHWQVDTRLGLSPSWVQNGVSPGFWVGFGYVWW